MLIIGSNPPLCLLIIVSKKFRGVSRNHTERWETSNDDRVSSNNAVASQRELSVIANYHCAIPQPAVLLDFDPAAFGHALGVDWTRYVGEFVVVIHDQNRRREKDILFENNLIPARYRRPSTNFTTRTQDNLRFWTAGRRHNVNPHIRSKIDVVTQIYKLGHGTPPIT